MMDILNHRLTGQGIVHLECRKNTRLLLSVDTVVFHYTAGNCALSSARYLVREDVQASAHLIIGRKGGIIQMLPFNIEAWHAGKSEYAGRKGLNRYSVGIELDNLGRLIRSEDRFYSESGHPVEPSEVYAGYHNGKISYWHAYPAVQLEVLTEVCRLLRATYPIRHWLGHSDITNRKIDPGPAFPLENILKSIFA